jgi:hypothetical protein
MKIAAITAACAALVAMAGTAEAANAPAELLNKTISVGWLVNANGVTAAGKQLTGGEANVRSMSAARGESSCERSSEVRKVRDMPERGHLPRSRPPAVSASRATG